MFEKISSLKSETREGLPQISLTAIGGSVYFITPRDVAAA
jgi:hypothetical protein